MWIKEIWRSFRKSLRIIDISKKVTYSNKVGNIFESLLESENKKQEGLHKLWEMIETDPYLSAVIKHHNADRTMLEKIYTQIETSGAGQFVKGHYIPVSAFSFVYPLEYILRITSKESFSYEDNLIMGITLIRYFRNGNIGPID